MAKIAEACPIAACPECRAPCQDEKACQARFDQMLVWEWEDAARLQVHHLMVLCFHLQHPSRYSPAGLTGAMDLLSQFVERGCSPAGVRKSYRQALDSGNRKWKIKGTPESFGAYQKPVAWPMTAADVIAGGADAYVDNVKAWAEATMRSLRASGNYTAASDTK